MQRYLLPTLLLVLAMGLPAQEKDAMKPEADPEFRPKLVSVEFSARRVQPDADVAVTYRFRNEGTKVARNDYRVFVHLESPRQSCECIVAGLDHMPTVPTSLWQPGKIIADGPHVFRAPTDKGDAKYFVHVGVFAPQILGGPRLLESYDGGVLEVSRDAPAQTMVGPDPMPAAEAARRRQLLAKRIQDPVELATDAFAFRLDQKMLTYELVDRSTGVRWSSSPYDTAFTTVALAGPAGKTSVAIRTFDRIRKRGNTLSLMTKLRRNGEDLGLGIRFDISLVDKPAGLRVRYGVAGKSDWAVESVKMLEDSFGTTEADNGYLVEPRRLGEMIPVAGALPRSRPLQTYSNITMAMYGLVKQNSGLLLAWPHPQTTVTMKIDWPQSELVPGTRMGSAAITLYGDAREFTIHPVGRGGYVAIAKAYRQVAKRNGWLMTWADKRKAFPSVDQMFGAADFKPFTFVRTITSKRHPGPERTHVGFTFDETAQCARHWHEDLGIDRAMVVLAGWIHRGYDNQHPDILPAAPECGGNEALAQAAQTIKAQGFLFGLHDNYQDMYRDAPSYDESFINKDAHGRIKQGGCWAGGQAYQVCAIKQVELAKRPQNLPAVAKLFGPTVYFIDTVFAWGLVTCEDPAHPMTRYDDMVWKSRLCDVAKEHFGLFGSEEGREWAVPHADYLEGLLGFKREATKRDNVIPLFELVYGDCVNINTHQSDRLGPGSAKPMLDHTLYAEMPVYRFGNHLYWQSKQASGVPLEPLPPVVKATGELSFEITYRWRVLGKLDQDPRCFVHFTHPRSKGPEDIAYQDDHALTPAPTTWQPGSVVEIGPRTVKIPPQYRGESQLLIGLSGKGGRLLLGTIPGQNGRYSLGTIRTTPKGPVFIPANHDTNTACFSRADQGWGADLCAEDRSIKNTYEVLSYLNRVTAESPMTDHAFVTADHRVERSAFGDVQILVNYGPEPYEHNGTVLPPYGLLVESPTFVAFHASRYRGIDYEPSALFTLRSLDGKPLAQSQKIRVYHGFGSPRVRIGTKTFTVEREAEITP
jgi:hypothetical protein